MSSGIVEVKGGICTGRNGTVEIGGLSVGGYGSVVRIDCISKKRCTILNAGIGMDRQAASKLAKVLKEYLKVSKG